MKNQKDIAPKIALGRWDPRSPPSKDNPIEEVEMTNEQKNTLEECRMVVLDALAELGIKWETDDNDTLHMIVPKELEGLPKSELFRRAHDIVEKRLNE